MLRVYANLKLLPKIPIPLGLLACVSVLSIWNASAGLRTIASTTQQLVDVSAARVITLNKLVEAVDETTIMEKNAILATDDTTAANFAKQHSAALEAAEQHSKTLLALAQTEERRAKIAEISALLQRNGEASRRAIRLALSHQIDEATAVSLNDVRNLRQPRVKLLADRTAVNEQEMRANRDATSKAVQAIGGIGKTIDQISEIAGCIAAAVEQQGAATQEIAGNVLQAAQGINEVSRDIEDVTRSSTDVGAAASQGLSSAGGLSQQAETLRHEVTQFLASVKAA